MYHFSERIPIPKSKSRTRLPLFGTPGIFIAIKSGVLSPDPQIKRFAE
jgi:hypothetical protein